VWRIGLVIFFIVCFMVLIRGVLVGFSVMSFEVRFRLLVSRFWVCQVVLVMVSVILVWASFLSGMRRRLSARFSRAIPSSLCRL